MKQLPVYISAMPCSRQTEYSIFYNNLATASKMWSKIFGQKSTKNTSPRSIEHKSKPLKPEDFDDVFGGPPRCICLHPADYFYEDMFQNPVRPGMERGIQDSPEFKISLAGGLNSELFCRDFINKDVDEVRGSKSSMLNSGQISPTLPQISNNEINLRRINVQSAWNNSSTILMHGVEQKHEEMPDFTNNRLVGKRFTDNEQQTDCFTSTRFGFSRRAGSSPESMSPGAYSYSSASVKVPVGDEDDYTDKFCRNENDHVDDEISSSYVFGINCSYRERTDEGLGVDEAIAWARESYQSHCSSAAEKSDRRLDGNKSLHLQGEYPNKMKTEKEQRNADEHREMELLEEEIKLWSSGKERNIELLLSTLQDILWPNSGWCPIPPTNLYESSNVKKAYQKARLCLHPDKLQQRGATLLQKYVAGRIFLILQDAWDAYISQDTIILS